MILDGCNFTPFSPRELSIVESQTYYNKQQMLNSVNVGILSFHYMHFSRW